MMSQPKQAIHDIASAGLKAMLNAFLALLAEVAIDPAQRHLIAGHVAEVETHIDALANVEAVPTSSLPTSSLPGGQNGGQSVQGTAIPTPEHALTADEMRAFEIAAATPLA